MFLSSAGPYRPEDLLASIAALVERTTKLALESAMHAAQADALGKVTVVVEQVCRIAVNAGVAAGEVAWLAGELEGAHASGGQLAAAGAAIADLQHTMVTVAYAVQDVADAGAPIEISSSAEALRRSALQLEDSLELLQSYA